MKYKNHKPRITILLSCILFLCTNCNKSEEIIEEFPDEFIIDVYASDIIAFSSDRDGNNEIYLMHGDGTELSRITYNSAINMFPGCSPGGEYVAFQTAYENNNDEITIIHIATENTTRLTHSLGWDSILIGNRMI